MATKTTTATLGATVKARTVTRPDGTTLTVAGGRRGTRGDYVLTHTGDYLIDGKTVRVEA